MQKEYREAFTEVNKIIKMLPDELINKIPKSFIEIIEEEQDKEYNPNIQEPLEKQILKNETIILLGLIYRDFLCSPDERKILQEKNALELREIEIAMEKEKREKYNLNDIFKNKINIEQFDKKETSESMIAFKEEKWYTKIFNIIKNIFLKDKK